MKNNVSLRRLCRRNETFSLFGSLGIRAVGEQITHENGSCGVA